MSRSIGIAVPTYNRAAMTLNVFRSVLEDPRVSAVAVSDDDSYLNVYRDLEAHVGILDKVTLARNDHNLGSWGNKRKAIELCQAKYVALIDSDNVIRQDFVDALFALSVWHKDVLYAPVSGGPVLDYSKYSGLVVDRQNIKHWLSESLFQMVLNTGNFFVHRESYLEVSDGPAETSYASDGIYFLYRWLASGRMLYVTPKLCYLHLIHHGHWMQTATASMAFANELIRRMQAGVWETSCTA